MAAKPLLYLIDGSSQMYRAFHAPIRTQEGTPLRDAQGRPTNAVYIFITMLRKLLKEHGPQFIAASFDLPGRTFRDDLAADYKANRAPMPDDLAVQIPLVHRACEALGVPIFTHDRYEADDVIGTMTERAAADGYDVAIVTGDKDFFQLVRDGIRVYNPKDDGTWYDTAGVKEKFGVSPDQVVDVLALMGDTIDNVKGVPGIGEKGARELISTYGSLDALLDRAADIPQKRYREALLTHADDARRSRELLRIHTDRPRRVRARTLPLSGAEPAGLLRAVLRPGLPLARDGVRAHGGHGRPKTINWSRTGAHLETLADELRSARSFGMHVMVDGPSAVRADIVGLVFAVAPRQARYIPLRSAVAPPAAPTQMRSLLDEEPEPVVPSDEPCLELAEVLAVLLPLLENSAIEKTGHDLKPSVIALARHGVTLRGLGLDTMLASYLLDATRSGHPLDGSALEYLGYKALTDDDVRGRGVKAVAFAGVSPCRAPRLRR